VNTHAQRSLFDQVEAHLRSQPAPLAARSDPATSHIAAREITMSGALDSQKRAVLDLLRIQLRPVTSAELAAAGGLDRYMVARRLPDLNRDGLVSRGSARRCDSTGRLAITWSAA